MAEVVKRMRHLAHSARWSLCIYFAIAIAFTWALLPFARNSASIGLIALFGPAVAAVVTAGLLGPDATRELWNRTLLWRVPIRWYLLAILLPLPVSAAASVVEYLAGAHGTLQLQHVTALNLLVFGLVIGEEIGWRGFALPRLLLLVGPWGASTLVGIAWAFWHFPLFFMPTMPQFGRPFPAFVVYTIALSLMLTYLAKRTSGSVVIATVFHGAVNTFVVENTAAGPGSRGWGNAVGYGTAAVLIGVMAWRGREAPESESVRA